VGRFYLKLVLGTRLSGTRLKPRQNRKSDVRASARRLNQLEPKPMPTPNADTRLSATRFRTNTEPKLITSPAGVVTRVRLGQECNAFRRENDFAGMQSFSCELRQGIVIAERERFPVQKNRLVLEVFGSEGVAF